MNQRDEQSKEAWLQERMDSAYDEYKQEQFWKSMGENRKIELVSGHILCNFFTELQSRMSMEECNQKVADYVGKRLETESTLNEGIRVRDTEYAIASTPYVAIADELNAMHLETQRLFEWYNNPMTSAAPCTPIVQSSGTGKTKLLFEFKKKFAKQNSGYQIILISCLPRDDRRQKQKGEPKVYDRYLNFNSKPEGYLQTELESKMLQSKVVLIFDEAQELANDSGKHLKALHKFLRKMRDKKTVAFFAGTNQNLANCYPRDEERRSSREGEEEGFYESGKTLNPPLFELNTMGCLAKKIKINPKESEFVKSIPYGRPLFATLLFDEADDTKWPVQMTRRIDNREMKIIATRLLLNNSNPFEKQALLPFASVWATRVQLGGVSTAVIQELVAKGYAHLTSFRAVNMSTDSEKSPQPTVTFANLPDPVVARLAMCLMDENWKLEVEGTVIKGSSKTKWTEKLKQLFSSGLCRPSRGDLGELVSAAYLLFCGDLLRYLNDPTFQTFSVPVSKWLSLLVDPVYPFSGGDEKQESYQPCINFIQFCRNNLRFGMKDVCNESFLEYIWNCCCAVYAYEGADNIDAYASIQYIDSDGNTQYTPLIISVKTRDNYSMGKATKNVDSIAKDLRNIGQSHALILVVLLDRDASEGTSDTEMADADENTTSNLKDVQEPPQKKDRRTTGTWQAMATASLEEPIENCTSKIVSRIVIIPSNDPFNLTDVVRGATRSKEESSVFDSHCFTGIVPASELCGNRKKDKGGVKSVLLSAATSEVEQKLSSLWNKRYESLEDASAMTVETAD